MSEEEDKKAEEIKRIGILVSNDIKEKWEEFAKKRNFTTVSRLVRKAVNFYINHFDQVSYLQNFSKLSHDLKEPLTSIKGFSQIILENYSDKIDPNVLLRLKEIYAQSVFLEQKINEILNGIHLQSVQYDILIIEDDTPTILLLSDYFKLKGYTSIGVNTGQKALNELEKFIPKIILLDIILPDIDGYEICRKIRSNENLKDVPIFYITAIPEAEVNVKSKETGATGFLLKPFDFKAFDLLFKLMK